ncbi:MAG: glycoside hydrolase [Cyclobacteriaceae bacterium]|nr:MAG: glycoside hydrolase [Cyclobacteriaceae bacterium]
MNNKYLCIHGHFYQPPRENAWLEEIEIQDSASPFHDWNERITHECYRPNGTSRILNGQNRIIDIVNNYAKISFNFGPTLLSWMEHYAPEVHAAILEADKLSMEHFDGHGSAMAQVYNHIIMPLASRRDQVTQVLWGLEDFRSRFGREAEGMWLAETAVNLETLEILADYGVKFTVLAPRQAHRYRKIGSSTWNNGIDSKRHYLCKLPSGKEIVLFFYDGERSQDVAFKGLLKNGRDFAETLVSSFDDRKEPQLVHIATDGESYGHHHRHGDMALAFCCRYIETHGLAQLTNYSQFMNLVKADYEVEIHENTSWSCFHGIERWRSNCGCGNESGYHQRWRAPLRESLNWLRDQLETVFETEMKPYTDQPWSVRDQYIQVILNRKEDFADQFLGIHIKKSLGKEERTKVIRLLEMQRQSLLMFTSCGWFFDEVSRIETVQILQYANRAIQLAERVSEVTLEDQFMEKLSKAQSNLPEINNASVIYQTQIQPKRISLTKVGMHYAVASLFDENPEHLRILNYSCVSNPFERYYAGVQILAIGKTSISSLVTLSQKQFNFAVLYIGQHHIIGSASDTSEETFNELQVEIVKAFKESRVYKVVDIMQHYFGGSNFSFFELFRDAQTEILAKIMDANIQSAASSYKRVYERNYNILNVMHSAGLVIPSVLKQNTEVVINLELVESLQRPNADLKNLSNLVEEVKKWEIPVDSKMLSFETTKKVNGLISKFSEHPDDIKILTDISGILNLVRLIDIDPSLNELQNQLLQISRVSAGRWSKSDKPSHKLLLNTLLKLASEVELDMTVPVLMKKS